MLKLTTKMKIQFFTKTSENEKINPKIHQNNPKMVKQTENHFFLKMYKNIKNIPIDPKMFEGRLIVIRNRKSIF